jgi:hypothetical protein
VTQGKVNSLVRLSESLRLQRTDRGEDLTALARADITAFYNRLAYLEDREQISARTRLNYCRDVRGVLGRMRAMGLTRPGKPLRGLPEDFVVTQDDLPDECEDTAPCRTCPWR